MTFNVVGAYQRVLDWVPLVLKVVEIFLVAQNVNSRWLFDSDQVGKNAFLVGVMLVAAENNATGDYISLDEFC